ncbi:MAG: response regulator [Candidatus Cohnella colombiensis]|uniref:Response regulator n=1 Tax=Candidatus Cohnella colombiensis TaxID=3121368 RepID=A0AA95JGC1_9BACL|nr:MAG: response regulator [Cohnella sp.]
MLIVDDEQGQVRELVDIVSALRPDFEVKGVNSGAEALKLIRSHEFDVVMTDIRMPQMDGLELIRHILQVKNDMLLVILSGFGDFQYAKKAIEYGVIEYLVKPVSKKSLLQLFERIVKARDEKKLLQEGQNSLHRQLEQSLPIYMEHQLNKWVLGEMNDNELQEISDLLPDQGRGIVMVSEVGRVKGMSGQYTSSQLKSMMDQVNVLLLNTLQSVGHTLMFTLMSHNKRMVFVTHAEHPVKLQTENLIKLLIPAIDQIENELKITLTIGISNPSDHVFRDIQTQFEQSVRALDYSFFRRDEKCIPFNTIRMESAKGQLNLYELENKLTVEINLGNLATIYGILNETFDQLNRTTLMLRPVQIKEYCIYIVLNLVEKIKLAIPDDQLEELTKRYSSQLYESEKCEEIRRVMKLIMDELVGFWTKRDMYKNEYLIQQCKTYIEQNYMKDLSLEAIASHVHFNPSYLSNLFKTYGGIGYSEYLTKVRIEKAQHLLQSSNLKIYEISSMVGYSDSTYFIKMFKKETGISPNRFRKMHKVN